MNSKKKYRTSASINYADSPSICSQPWNGKRENRRWMGVFQVHIPSRLWHTLVHPIHAVSAFPLWLSCVFLLVPILDSLCPSTFLHDNAYVCIYINLSILSHTDTFISMNCVKPFCSTPIYFAWHIMSDILECTCHLENRLHRWRLEASKASIITWYVQCCKLSLFFIYNIY